MQEGGNSIQEALALAEEHEEVAAIEGDELGARDAGMQLLATRKGGSFVARAVQNQRGRANLAQACGAVEAGGSIALTAEGVARLGIFTLEDGQA